MTTGCPEFDGDSHPRKADWFGMTCSNGPTNSQFSEPQNDTERVRLGTKTDHVRHDLAVGPADKFQIYLSAE